MTEQNPQADIVNLTHWEETNNYKTENLIAEYFNIDPAEIHIESDGDVWTGGQWLDSGSLQRFIDWVNTENHDYDHSYIYSYQQGNEAGMEEEKGYILKMIDEKLQRIQSLIDYATNRDVQSNALIRKKILLNLKHEIEKEA